MKNLYWLPVSLLVTLSARAQAPTVASLSPARNGVAPSRAANVVLTFSQPLSASLPGSAVRVFSTQRGGQLTSAVTVSGNTLTVDPDRDFRVGEEVSVTATTGIRSSGGTALATPQAYRFRVRPVGGTGVLGTRVFATVGGNPTFVATADVDGDSDLDALTANEFDGTVSVRLNNGLGTFSGGSTVTVGTTPAGLAMADVEGDGDLDLLCANRGSATVSVRLNNGSGSFGAGAEVAVGAQPAAVTTADVDGDGDLDLVAANRNAGAAEVRLNNGTGSPLTQQRPVPATYLSAWPNPARSQVQLTGLEARQPVILLDAVGRILLTQQADGTGSVLLELPASLPAGAYVVKSANSTCLLSVE